MSAADRDLEGRVRTDAQAALAPLGLCVDDLSITRAGKRRVVRIAVDDDLSAVPEGDETTPVPPVTLDAVADATRAIDATLEESDVLGQAPYVLEVTSPGTSSPLTRPRHFRRNVGRLVHLTLGDGTQAVGRIVAAGPSELTIHADPSAAKAAKPRPGAATPREPRTVAYVDIAKAGVQVEFTRADASFEEWPDDAFDDASEQPHDEQED